MVSRFLDFAFFFSDIFGVFRVFESGGFSSRYTFGRFLSFFWAALGMAFCIFRPAELPHSVPGLVWVIGSLVCDTGHVFGVLGPSLGGLWRIFVLFLSFVPTSPPRSGARGDQGKMNCSYQAQNCMTFEFNLFAFPGTHSRPTPPLPVVWQ